MLIREMAPNEQPRTRLQEFGATQLSNAELLALVLGGNDGLEVATTLLARSDGLAGLARADRHSIVRAIGKARADRVITALELTRRMVAVQPKRQAIHSPADIAALMAPRLSDLDREHLQVVLLNTKNHVLAIQPVYVGSVNTAVVRPAEVFAEAIRRVIPAIVVVHNHPSGDPTPSPEDVDTTSQLVQAGKLLDIDVLDHLVIGQGQFVSMKEQRLGFA